MPYLQSPGHPRRTGTRVRHGQRHFFIPNRLLLQRVGRGRAPVGHPTFCPHWPRRPAFPRGHPEQQPSWRTKRSAMSGSRSTATISDRFASIDITFGCVVRRMLQLIVRHILVIPSLPRGIIATSLQSSTVTGEFSELLFKLWSRTICRGISSLCM
jgi:hypothetical protein